jgi:hypothetical protein
LLEQQPDADRRRSFRHNAGSEAWDWDKEWARDRNDGRRVIVASTLASPAATTPLRISLNYQGVRRGRAVRYAWAGVRGEGIRGNGIYERPGSLASDVNNRLYRKLGWDADREAR